MQNKTNVTNGYFNLEVGQSVTGYTGGGLGDENWNVLGAQNGRLLLITNTNQDLLVLSGRQAWVDSIDLLNNLCAPYQDNSMAIQARTVTLDDINRVTGFVPQPASTPTSFNPGPGYGYTAFVEKLEHSLKHGFTSRLEDASITNKYTSCVYWDGNEWKDLKVGETFQFEVTAYSYSPSDLFYNVNGEDRPFSESIAYRVLFEDTGPAFVKHYWLGTKAMYAGLNGVVGYEVFTVDSAKVKTHGICDSINDSSSMAYETRNQTSYRITRYC